MQRDIRQTPAFKEAEAIFAEVGAPGENIISDIADIQRSAEASHLLFTGTVLPDIAQGTATRICACNTQAGSIRLLTSGPNSDRHARLSPDRGTIAFLSDRDRRTDFQLFTMDMETLAVTPGPTVDGWVEYCEWSPDGSHILLGVAGHGADLSSGQGAYTSAAIAGDEPDWMPQVIGQPTDAMRRSAWIVDVATRDASCVTGADTIWEASWCGNDRLVVVTSPQPGEGAWYGAGLSLVDCATGIATVLYQPATQIAMPRCAPAGHLVAFIEAVSSDRGYVAGDLRLFDLRDGTSRILDTAAVDTTCIEWRSDTDLLVAGHRGLDTVVLAVTTGAGVARSLWQSTEITTAQAYATVVGLDQPDDFAFVCESFIDRPRIATVRAGVLQVSTAAEPGRDIAGACVGACPVRWHAPDGLPIEGWLLRPGGEPPYATIMVIHGGPVLHWRPYWLGRDALAVMLLRRGYALFLPNPRGSSGRGQAFAARVVGDVGGADTADFLTGIDCLVEAGIANPARLGVTGLSYGGFMTCWLTTQDDRFGAGISVGPATNHVSHHLLGNIPQFDNLFLGDHYTNVSGTYYTRSPLLYAAHSKTPTLLVCGDLDRCTPPEEALQFHAALLENGVEAVVVRYPLEGHGVHGIPAAIDFAARCVMWFERHIPVRTHLRTSRER
jgi:dipeptidyl aminopeptidase/acylaminoacyl peptidase